MDTENVRQVLKETKAEVIRLKKYIDDITDEREKLLKTLNDKIQRLNTSYKILEGQHEVVVSDKIHIQRQMGQLKHKNEQQELQIVAMQKIIDSFSEEKKKVAEKFHLLKDQEKVQDIVIGALKRQFEEQINEFLNETDTGNSDRQSADVLSGNMSASTNMSRMDAGLVAGATNNGTGLIITEDEDSHSIGNGTDSNDCQTMESDVRGRTEVTQCFVLMRKKSGTTVKSSSITMEMTRTKKVKTQQLIGQRCSVAVPLRKFDKVNSKEVVPTRPKRLLTCSFCSKRYKRTATGFCKCRNV